MNTDNDSPSPALSDALRELEGLLEGRDALRDRPAAERALDRLKRDLLPRTAGGDQSLVVGIVGPNNAGKSALFNALTGADNSPSLSTGGATRRLVGAARPELAARLRAAKDWTRFELRDYDPTDPNQAKQALSNAADPAELMLVNSESVPAGILLIDTPDFDSIAHENRFASEALLAVADVVVAVVTRHSYQNAEVVHYLARWLGSGRPWVLVYNEAPSPELVAEHALKLTSDLGHAPWAIYQAPFDRDVMEGKGPLTPRRLDGPTAGQSLADELSELPGLEQLKRAALSAGLGQLKSDLAELRDGLGVRGAAAEAVRSHARLLAADSGRRIASRAMPIGPFVDAFRVVLDRRSNSFSRGWRSGVRAVRTRIEAIPKLLLGKSVEQREAAARGGLMEVERRETEAQWPGFFEELARDLGPEQRHAARKDASEALSEALDTDLSGGGDPGLDLARKALLNLPAEFDDFQRACEGLVERALDERGFEWDLKVVADVATLLPAAVAGAMVLTTGGLGADVAVVGTGTLTTGLFERFTPRLVGSRIVREARGLWQEERGAALAGALLDSALSRSSAPLNAAIEEGQDLGARLDAIAVQVTKAATETESR